MSQYYELDDSVESNPGAPPVKLADMKKALRLPDGDHPDDDFVAGLIAASTADVEAYTSRAFRTATWNLYVDEFTDRIELRRDPVDQVTAVNYLVDGSWTLISSSTYYTKKKRQFSELLLAHGETWPTDIDTVEAGIRITFTVSVHPRVDVARAAIKRHVSFMYENRGDCDPADSRDALKASGAEAQLARRRIARV